MKKPHNTIYKLRKKTNTISVPSWALSPLGEDTEYFQISVDEKSKCIIYSPYGGV
jgi:hypothetical protein